MTTTAQAEAMEEKMDSLWEDVNTHPITNIEDDDNGTSPSSPSLQTNHNSSNYSVCNISQEEEEFTAAKWCDSVMQGNCVQVKRSHQHLESVVSWMVKKIFLFKHRVVVGYSTKQFKLKRKLPI